MSRTTLVQYKQNLISEASDIEKLIERRHATPEKRQRLIEIEEQLRVLKMMEKPNSITKLSKLNETEVTQ